MATTSPTDTVARFAALAATARLETDTSQRVFRTLLDALSHPGRIHRCPLLSGVPAPLLPLLALADVETGIAVVGDSTGASAAEWEALVAAVTGARRSTPQEAGWVAALDRVGALVALTASSGSAAAPEDAARLVLGVDDLSEHPIDGAVTLVMSGPGIPGSRRISVAGLPAEVFTRLDRVNQAFPAGLDTWLVTADGLVVGLPRSVDLLVTTAGGR